MNPEIDDEEFEKAQGATYAFLEGRGDESITELRKDFVDIFNGVFDSPAVMFYSSLSVMELQGALEVEEDRVNVTGDFKPVPPGDWHSVRAELNYELSTGQKEEFADHFIRHFAEDGEVELGETGSRIRKRDSYGTGYSVDWELSHLTDVNHTWADIEVEVPVAYLTPAVEELVERDLYSYAGYIAGEEYEKLMARADRGTANT